jgi:hypothetical protein
MKLYNYQRNEKVLYIFIYLLLPYIFRGFFQPISRGRCTTVAVVQVSWYGVSARALNTQEN